MNIDLTKKTVPQLNAYYVDEYGMVVQKKREWQTKNEIGDSLFLTSLTYLMFKNDENSHNLLEGIKSCFVKIKINETDYYYQAYRHPTLPPIDTSRDQVNAAIACLYLSGEKELAIEYAKNLKWKLSEKFNQTLDFRLWLQTLYSNDEYSKNKNLKAYYYVSTIVGHLSFAWNRIVRFLGNFNPKPLKDFKSNYYEINFFRKFMAKLQFPTYAFFLWVLQILTLPESPEKQELIELMLMECEESNYAIRLLLGDKTISRDVIDEHISTFGFRWNMRLDDSVVSSPRPLTDDEKSVNDIDLGFLLFAFDYNEKKYK